MNEEMNKFHRKLDNDNLSKIPVMETTLMFISKDIAEIKDSIKLVSELKTEIGWLKSGARWMAGIVGGIIIAMTGLFFKR